MRAPRPREVSPRGDAAGDRRHPRLCFSSSRVFPGAGAAVAGTCCCTRRGPTRRQSCEYTLRRCTLPRKIATLCLASHGSEGSAGGGCGGDDAGGMHCVQLRHLHALHARLGSSVLQDSGQFLPELPFRASKLHVDLRCGGGIGMLTWSQAVRAALDGSHTLRSTSRSGYCTQCTYGIRPVCSSVVAAHTGSGPCAHQFPNLPRCVGG